MAQGSLVHRIVIDLSDVERGVYETLELRVAQHASEDRPRVVSRVLAYCLNYEEGIQFGRGLDEAEDPAISVKDLTGQCTHWIDVGHPGGERMHRASKQGRYTVFCHKGPEGLRRERDKRRIHNADKVAVFLVEPEFIGQVADALSLASQWSVIRSGTELMLNIGDVSLSGDVVETTLAEL